jgi:hypothetical protein
MNILTKNELRSWSVYLATVFISVYIHEIGHCIPAWLYGYRAIPTPAKEYMTDMVPPALQQIISLGGITGSILSAITIIFIYILKPFKFDSAILAGAIACPGMYSIMFILKGRGHDSNEFQGAQSAIGLNYSGHSLDWIFLAIFILGTIVWLLKSRPSFSIIGKLVAGVFITFIFLVLIQDLNNKIFDPIFQFK